MFLGTVLVKIEPDDEDIPELIVWQVVFTRQSQKDSLNLASAGLRLKAGTLLAVLRLDPFQAPPPYEKLRGDLAGAHSSRINIQHCLVYEVDKDTRTVKVLRMWTCNE